MFKLSIYTQLMAGEWKTTLSTLYWDSSTDLPAIGSPVYYKSDSLYHANAINGLKRDVGMIMGYESAEKRKSYLAVWRNYQRVGLVPLIQVDTTERRMAKIIIALALLPAQMGHATETRFCENISFIQGAQRGDWVVDGDNLNPTPENQGLYLDVAGEEMPLVGNLDPHLNVAGEETPPVGNLDPHLNVAGEEMPLVGNLDPHLNVAGEETPPVGNLEQPINWCWNLEGHKAIVPPTPGKNLPPPRNNTQHTGLEQCDTSVSGPGTIRVSGDARPENGPDLCDSKPALTVLSNVASSVAELIETVQFVIFFYKGLKIISPKSSFVEQQSQRSSWFSYLGSQCWFEDWGGRDVESGTRDLKVGLKVRRLLHGTSIMIMNKSDQVFRCRLSSATAKTDFLQVYPKEGHSIWAMPCDIVDDMVDKSLGRFLLHHYQQVVKKTNNPHHFNLQQPKLETNVPKYRTTERSFYLCRGYKVFPYALKYPFGILKSIEQPISFSWITQIRPNQPYYCSLLYYIPISSRRTCRSLVATMILWEEIPDSHTVPQAARLGQSTQTVHPDLLHGPEFHQLYNLLGEDINTCTQHENLIPDYLEDVAGPLVNGYEPEVEDHPPAEFVQEEVHIDGLPDQKSPDKNDLLDKCSSASSLFSENDLDDPTYVPHESSEIAYNHPGYATLLYVGDESDLHEVGEQLAADDTPTPEFSHDVSVALHGPVPTDAVVFSEICWGLSIEGLSDPLVLFNPIFWKIFSKVNVEL
uniref:Uncharacterized protein n=1 Tax=Timema poppense TaxID=170557 RepID=A0A7R9CM43_TIMPO|nr:unnamed protein product [Timema poppensis]